MNKYLLSLKKGALRGCKSGELVLSRDLNPCPLGPKGGNDRVLGVLGFVMI